MASAFSPDPFPPMPSPRLGVAYIGARATETNNKVIIYVVTPVCSCSSNETI